jgi:tRNA threonylcarbamoyladenosine modification (KEOPS) complex Cgi121 subunit
MFSALNCSSTKPVAELMVAIKESGAKATLVWLKAVYSPRQLQAAYELAKQSMADGSAVSNRLEMEFLMWLGQSPHANKAIERAGAKDGKQMILVLFEGGEKEAMALAKRIGLQVHGPRCFGCADALDYWDVPRADGVEREMLLLEQMALSRLKE